MRSEVIFTESDSTHGNPLRSRLSESLHGIGAAVATGRELRQPAPCAAAPVPLQISTVRPEREGRGQRKLAMLQRAGLFADGTPGIVIERARTAEEFKAAYRLVHDIYVERGYCREKDWGMRLRIYEATAHMATFIARTDDGAVVGVLSVVGDCERFGLPSENVFASEIGSLRGAGFRLCEVTNQAVHPRYRKTAVPTELMRCAMAHGVVAGYQRAIATVSPGHTSFYNLLNFFSIGPVRNYSEVLHDPVVALCGDLDFYRAEQPGDDDVSGFIHRYMAAGNPFVARVAQWSREAPDRFLNAALLRSLFAPSFLEECSEPEIEFIEAQWGWSLFDRVTEPNPIEPGLEPSVESSIRCGRQRRDVSECWFSTMTN